MTNQIATVTSFPRNCTCHYELCIAKRRNLIKKCAFTLAEVLITLGIIGVVAAITLPVLVQNYQKHVIINRLKVAYTTIGNAIDQAVSDYGDAQDWYIPDGVAKVKSDYVSEHYLIPYLNIVKDCNHSKAKGCVPTNKSPDNSVYTLVVASSRVLLLSNGVAINVFSGSFGGTSNDKRILIYLYINGIKDININGKDVFYTELGGYEGAYTFNPNKLMPYGFSNSKDRINYTTGSNSCNKNSNGMKCFALILYDNWKITKDYPW